MQTSFSKSELAPGEKDVTKLIYLGTLEIISESFKKYFLYRSCSWLEAAQCSSKNNFWIVSAAFNGAGTVYDIVNRFKETKTLWSWEHRMVENGAQTSGVDF